MGTDPEEWLDIKKLIILIIVLLCFVGILFGLVNYLSTDIARVSFFIGGLLLFYFGAMWHYR